MRWRRWLLVAGVVVGALTAVVGALYLVALSVRHTETATRTFDGPVRRITINAQAGRVRLARSEGGRVEVERKAVRSLGRPTITERLDGDRLQLSDGCPWFGTLCSVDWTVRVPDGTAVDVSASGGGVDAVDLRADMNLRSSGGGVHVTGGVGSLRLRSSAGGVSVEGAAAPTVDADSSGGGVRLSLVAVPGGVRAHSSAGGVSVEVPLDPAAYRVNAHSSGGGTHVSVRTDPFSERRITASSSGGGVTVRYPKQP